jgi:peroxiredoxin
MQELRQRYDGRDFEIIAVNVAQSKTHTQKIVSEYGATFPVALDTDQKAADAYNVRSLPTTFVVDKDRRIIKKKEGFMDGKELNAILLKLVNTPENI